MPLLQSIGINITTVESGYCGASFGSAFSAPSPVTNHQHGLIIYGSVGNEVVATFDIFAHELGHTFLNEFIEYDGIDGESLQEGIADIIGTYIEYLVQGSTDWIMGDDNPNFPSNFHRQLNDLSNLCFTNVKFSNDKYIRSRPITNWFYLIANGSVSENIPALGMDKAMKILLNAIKLMGNNGDYPDLKNAVINNVLSEYGKCSDEYLAVVKAFIKICVIPAHDCYFVIGGPSAFCEELDYIQLCISGGLPNTHYRWTFIGPRTTEWVASGSQTGNSVEGGTCLTILDLPKYDYYPQYFTITAYAPMLHPNYLQKKTIKLVDCNGDDPACGEVNSLIINSISINSIENEELFSRLSISDIFGYSYYFGVTREIEELYDILPTNKILILKYSNGKSTKNEIKKLIILNK